MTNDLAVAMTTTDRGEGRNYLWATLENLLRGGLITSRRVSSLALAASKRTDHDFVLGTLFGALGGWPLWKPILGADRCANLNFSAALESGANDGAPWVLFIEDDVDVCADFFASVGAWLDEHAAADCPVYAFGCAYPQVDVVVADGGALWVYPVRAFYGTQSFAVRSADARSIASYVREHCFDINKEGVCYDLLMHGWAKERGVESFAASCPSFVQHVGAESVVNPREHVHTFPSWRGRGWSYTQARQARREAS